MSWGRMKPRYQMGMVTSTTTVPVVLTSSCQQVVRMKDSAIPSGNAIPQAMSLRVDRPATTFS